jgi:tetratricopeptide (TPR) repeat protein
LQQIFDRVEDLVMQGRAREAVERLEPLLASHPREADLHYYLGYARAEAGDLWGGLAGYERAMELSDNPGYWLPLASLYLELGLNALALNAFRQVLKWQPDIPMIDSVRETVASLEQDLQSLARTLDLPVKRVEKGLYHLSKGQRALHTGDFRACVVANRQAIVQQSVPGLVF